jgi:uncharacterized protein YfaS (alpha-2-macroglobulin family)
VGLFRSINVHLEPVEAADRVEPAPPVSNPHVPRFALAVAFGAVIIVHTAGAVLSQERTLGILSTSPAGEVGQMVDANEIRILFSEPMVELGGAVTTPPAWLSISPAFRANYYWSGTRTLIVTADPDTPLPFATRYTVRIEPTARSAAGHQMPQPYSFTFSTPGVRLLGADWYRKTGRADSQAIIALRFNQPVRPADVLAHTVVRHEPHQWERPTMSARARERLQREDAAGLARFDEKVVRVAATVVSTSPVPVALATSWDEKRFPGAPHLVVLETEGVPATDGWLRVTVDDRMPSPGGTLTGPMQTSVIRLEPTFFHQDIRCVSGCAPGNSHFGLRRNVRTDAAIQALSLADISAGKDARVPRSEGPPPSYMQGAGGQTFFQYVSLGYPDQPPMSTWVLRLDRSLTAVDGQTLDYPWMEVIDNIHATPYAGWSGSVWEAANGPVVPFLARNVTEAATWAAPIRPEDLLPRLLLMRERSPQLAPEAAIVSQRLGGTADDVEGHPFDLARILSTKGPGLVWAAFAARGARPNTPPTSGFGAIAPALLQVTNLGLTVKDSPHSTLMFVTRLDNAQPVAGARVVIRVPSGELWSGTTGLDGVALAPALDMRPSEEQWRLSYVVTADKDGDTAWVASDWTGDVHPSGAGIWYGLGQRGEVLRGAVVTDRGVYAKGEEVRLKGVFRNDTASGMRILPEGTRVALATYDSRGRELDRRVLPVNRWGSLDWALTLPADASLGNHRVVATLASAKTTGPDDWRTPSVSGTFLVAAFRRPDFRVETTVKATPPMLGTTLSGLVEAKYLFGTGVGRQPVRWYVTKQMVQRIPDEIRQRFPERQFAFGYQPEPSPGRLFFQQVVQKNESLDASGRVAVEVPTDAGDDFASSFQLEGEVANAAGQRIANRSEVVLHPASFYIGLGRPPFFADMKAGLNTTVVAADHSGTARPGVPVSISLWREQWTNDPRPENPGSTFWVRKELAAGEWKLTTQSKPVPLSVTSSEGGCFILRATAMDERGRPTRTDVRFYVLGGGASTWRTDGNRITLVPERASWKPGETARVLVQSPWERATALVTKEREGIRTYSRIEITSTQDAVEVPIAEEDIPNVYVSVLLLKGRTAADGRDEGTDPGRPAFRVGYAELGVDIASKRLTVDVKASREEFRPRDRVDVSVSVADVQGRPRSSEVTLWAMDHGLLSLTDYKTPDVARAVYARKALQVQTQDNRSRLIARRSIVSVPGDAGKAQGGGGGGRGGGQGQMGEAQGLGFGVAGGAAGGVPAPPPAPMASPRVNAATELIEARSSAVFHSEIQEGEMQLRTDFRPLVFWLGSVATDANGTARTTVTLPDSLTTYRIMAVAGDLQSHFGSDDAEIRTSKPVTLLPSFPRFLSQGDRATFGAIVTNNTGRAGDATVRIRSLDPALELGATAMQTIRLASGESRNVRFDALARATGSARVRMTVTIGSETDAFELPLPITMPVTIETVAAYGDTLASATERISLPTGAVADRGGLTIGLSSTALVGLGESARYLDEYPYKCAEQLASRSLAMLLSADLGGAFGAQGVKPDELRANGIRMLNDLLSYQCPDGGFGSFAGSCYGTSSVYLTAYVAHVFQRSAALGVATDRNVLERALSFLQNQMRQPPPEAQWWPAWAASQAFAVRVLAEGGRNPRADLDGLYGQVDRIPVFALSYLADAFAAVNDRGFRYQDLVRRISNALRVDADRAHVQERDDAALVWLWNSNVRATAVVLDGLARRRDEATFVAPLVRWLLAARSNGRWGTTQENAVALGALVNYYRAFESEAPVFTATVSLGGRSIGNASFAGRSTVAQHVRLEMPELIRQVAGAAASDLVIARNGTGRLFYAARLQYAVPTPPVPIDRGLRVERRYERYTPDALGPASTTFADGDLIRVTVAVSLPHEGRFLAFTDPIPAGFEPVDGTLKTTAMDLGAVSTTQTSATDRFAWWRRGGFDHVEKHDDKVMAFATRLGAGRHEFTYLVRATTAGTFSVAGTFGEAMYAPEIMGRGAATTVTVK